MVLVSLNNLTRARDNDSGGVSSGKITGAYNITVSVNASNVRTVCRCSIGLLPNSANIELTSVVQERVGRVVLRPGNMCNSSSVTSKAKVVDS